MLKPIILIVDDEREHRSMLSAILKRDHHVLTAPDGESALRVADEETLDLALVDQRMPGMTGIEVLQSLRETQPRCGRILVTAYTDAALLQEAINRAAVYRFFSKPCDPELLRLDVKRAIEHQRAQNDLRRTERLAVLGGLAQNPGILVALIKLCVIGVPVTISTSVETLMPAYWRTITSRWRSWLGPEA